MTTSFSYMGNIPGVLGAFCIQRGRVEESSLPLIFDGDALGLATVPLAEVLEELSRLPTGRVTSALLSFGDVCVLLRALPEERVLGVVCQSHADLMALRPLLDQVPLPSAPLLAVEAEGISSLYPLTSAGQVSDSSGVPSGTDILDCASEDMTASAQEHAASRARVSADAPLTGKSLPPRTAARSRVTSANRPASITSDLRLRIQHELAQFVGPVAGLLVEDHLAYGASLPQLIERLSSEIEEPEDRQVFVLRLNDLSPG